MKLDGFYIFLCLLNLEKLSQVTHRWQRTFTNICNIYCTNSSTFFQHLQTVGPKLWQLYTADNGELASSRDFTTQLLPIHDKYYYQLLDFAER